MQMLFVKIINTAVFLQGVKFLPYQIQKVGIKVEVINISTVWKILLTWNWWFAVLQNLL